MSYIHLRHYHNHMRPVDHCLFKDVKTVSEEELAEMVDKVLEGGKPDELILALIGCVSMLLGRYAARFPWLERYMDDMASVGFQELTTLCNNIPAKKVKERGILKIASQRVQAAVENEINRLQALVVAPQRTQSYLIGKGEEPVYLTTEENEYTDNNSPEDLGDEWKRDFLDALDAIPRNDKLDCIILNKDNWGRTNKEIAKEAGVSTKTVRRRKADLYCKYLELTR